MVGAETGEWHPELCAIGGVDPAMQAELGWAGRPIGPIVPEVAAYTGLPADTLVVAGGGDEPARAWAWACSSRAGWRWRPAPRG